MGRPLKIAKAQAVLTITDTAQTGSIATISGGNLTTETPVPIFLSQVKIISHKEKNEWQLTPKYNIGKKPQSN